MRFGSTEYVYVEYFRNILYRRRRFSMRNHYICGKDWLIGQIVETDKFLFIYNDYEKNRKVELSFCRMCAHTRFLQLLQEDGKED